MKEKILFLLFYSEIIGYWAENAENSKGLELALNIRKLLENNRNTAEIILINSGQQPIALLTQHMGQSFGFRDSAKRFATLKFSLCTKFSWQNHPLITSKYKYFPVTLQPGEATIYSPLSAHFEYPFSRLAEWPALETLQVVYEIPEEDGRRYGIWYGRITSAEYKIVNAEIQPPDSQE